VKGYPSPLGYQESFAAADLVDHGIWSTNGLFVRKLDALDAVATLRIV